MSSKNQMAIFGLLILVFPASAQVWVRQESGQHAAMFSVQFVDSLRGWSVGDSGLILHTRTAGAQWIQQASGVKWVLRKVFFSDSLHGWAVGSRGTVVYTRDGGTTWQQKAMGLKPPFWDVQFTDSLHGWIVGGTQSIDGVFGTIYKTTDGGVSWTQKVANNVGGFQGVYFLDSLRGWVVGGKTLNDNFDPDIILHTTDGGESWDEQQTPTTGPLYRVAFSDSVNGWAGGFSNPAGTVALHTTDGGTTWLMVPFQSGPIVTSEGIADLEVVDSNVIWLIRGNSVHSTTNGGLSWQVVNPSEPFGTLGVSFPDRTHGWLVGGGGCIWRYAGLSAGVIKEVTPFQGASLSVFPNPSNAQISIHIESIVGEPLVVEVWSLLGQRVLRTNSRSDIGANTIVLNVSTLGSGAYFVRVVNREMVQQGRFIIQK